MKGQMPRVTAALISALALTSCVTSNDVTTDGGTTSTATTIDATTTSTTRPKSSVEFTSPSNGDSVPSEITPEGTSQNTQSGEEFWIVLVSGGNYYPQTGPILVGADGSWKASKIFIGNKNDSGTDWQVLAVFATSGARSSFVKYLQHGQKTGDYPGLKGLPAGATIGGNIRVTRE